MNGRKGLKRASMGVELTCNLLLEFYLAKRERSEFDKIYFSRLFLLSLLAASPNLVATYIFERNLE